MPIKAFVGLILITFFVDVVSARPEYAARHKIVSCSVCHYSATGAGPRNLNGKYYGYGIYSDADQSELKKWWQLDLHMNAYAPRNREANANGFALMNATAAVAVPLTKQNEDVKSRAVISYEMSMIATNSPRDAYVQYLSLEKSETNLPLYILTIGRFIPPFGLLTDEHRSFARLQTKSTINDYDMGVMYSREINSRVHIDFALVDGFAQGGKFTAGTPSAPEATSAVYANFRWAPEKHPGFVGYSYSNHQSLLLGFPVYAQSVYSIINLDRVMSLENSTSFLFEVVQSRGWNNQKYNSINMAQFIPSTNTALQTELEQQDSLSATAELKYSFSKVWMGNYKFEQIVLDKTFDADIFSRHSFGIKYFIDSSSNIMLRYETAQSGFKEIDQQSVRANRDVYYAIFHVWF